MAQCICMSGDVSSAEGSVENPLNFPGVALWCELCENTVALSVCSNDFWGNLFY